jgi:hypothetical protein
MFLKSVKKHLKLILVVPLFIIFSASVYLPSNQSAGSSDVFIPEVCAVGGSGTTCVNNPGTCPAGSVNFLNAFNEGTFAFKPTDYSRSTFESRFRSAWGNEAENICINTSAVSSDIIPYDGVQLGKICPSGWQGSRIPQSGTGAFQVWGCCPSNYQLISLNGASSASQAQGETACCLRPSGSAQPYTLSIYYKGTATRVQSYELYKECVDSELNPIWNQDTFNGQDVYITGAEDGRIDGRPLHGGDAPSFMSVGTRTGPTQVCPGNIPTGSGCVITDQPVGTDPNNVANISYQGEVRGITRPDVYAGSASTASCLRCFENGDPMAIQSDQLMLCNNGTKQATPLVNNSVADTLAVLRAGGLNTENGALIADCRAVGGIPTAIGCVDTTPLGIITGLIRIAFGVMGGVALLQMILAGIAYQSGDEAKIKEAREKLIATFTGVAVLVFSVLILRILGVNILDVIPSGTI